MSRADALLWLERYGAMPRPLELLGFVDEFGSYVAGYTAAADGVRHAIDDASVSDEGARWHALERVILHKCL
jgi:hypothetical protein